MDANQNATFQTDDRFFTFQDVADAARAFGVERFAVQRVAQPGGQHPLRRAPPRQKRNRIAR